MSALLFVAGRIAVIQDAGGNAMTTVIVFGGSGFLGRRLVRHLVAEGANVRVAVRHPDRARSALRASGVGGVTVIRVDVRDQASVTAAVAGADAVVNAVSAYVEKGGVTFEAVHEHGAETIAREAVTAGVARLVLVSGIGADPGSGSPYPRARPRRTCGAAGVPGRYHPPPGRHVWSGRRAVRHARRTRPAVPGAAADRRRPDPPATGLCGGRGGGHLPHARRLWDCGPDL